MFTKMQFSNLPIFSPEVSAVLHVLEAKFHWLNWLFTKALAKTFFW